MPDRRLDGAAPSDVAAQALRDVALKLVVVNLRAWRRVSAAIAKVYKDLFRLVVSQDLHLLQCFQQGVAIVGIARHGPHPHYQPFFVRGRDGDLHAEFIGLAGFAFSDAFRFRCMQAVELMLVALLLCQQAFDLAQ